MSDPSQPTPPPPPVPPAPQYGEYAPEGYVPPRPAPGYEHFQATQLQPTGVRTRKTWDVVLTAILLVMGAFGSLFGVIYGFAFANPELLKESLAQAGYPDWDGQVGAGAPVLLISHIVLYLVAIGGSIPLLVTKRLAFWLPLAAGILAAIIFWTTGVMVLMSDPSVFQQS